MGLIEFLKEEFQLVNVRLRHHEPQRFVKSQWSFIHRVVYIIYRWIVAAYLVTICVMVGIKFGSAHFFIYLTNWTFLLLTSSYVIRAVGAVYFHLTWERSDMVSGAKGEDHMPWYLKLLWIWHNASASPSLTITGVYYIAIREADQGFEFLDFAVHASNSILILLDKCITAVPMRALHVHHPVIYSIVYSVFYGIYHAAGGTTASGETAVYPFVDFDKDPGLAVGLLLVKIFVVVPILHLVLWLLHVLRVYLSNHCCNGTVDAQNSQWAGSGNLRTVTGSRGRVV